MIIMKNDFKQTYQKLLSLTNLSVRPHNDSQAELKLSMKRTADFLKALGNPQKKMKFIHIAGTSGKGSVAFLIHQILNKSGKNVGTYLSPHTTSYLERFQFNDKLIDPKILTNVINDVIDTYQTFLKNNNPLSFFELSTCIAIKTFYDAGTNWCVLEAGCGGRWDATNVIPPPVLAIITNINKDHTEILGNSLTKIAIAKSGIIKNESIVLCGEIRPSLKKVFTREAIKNNAALFFIPPPNDDLINHNFGYYQQHNAAIAKRAAEELKIDEPIIWEVLNNPKYLPCRFETIQKTPLIILDGAHSPAKITSTVERIKLMEKNIHIIFGCTANKDAKEMLQSLSKIAKTITTTRFKSTFRKATNPQSLLKMIPIKQRGGAFLDFENALNHVKKIIKKDDIIVVTGSLYLAGEMRAFWIDEDSILKNQSSYNNLTNE